MTRFMAAGIALRPFYVSVAPRVCSCNLPAKDLGRFKRKERAIAEITGYWSIYLGFFGDQMVWLDFLVTDLRSGEIVWRNGRPTTGGTNGYASDPTETATRGNIDAQFSG